MSTTPYQGYNPVTATQSVLTKYATFSGRATRSEYWWFYLVYTIINGLFVLSLGDDSIITQIVQLALLLPSLAVFVRRMHDIGRSGWNILWSFLPIIGWIVLLVYCCIDSKPGSNTYGPSEKYPEQ